MAHRSSHCSHILRHSETIQGNIDRHMLCPLNTQVNKVIISHKNSLFIYKIVLAFCELDYINDLERRGRASYIDRTVLSLLQKIRNHLLSPTSMTLMEMIIWGNLSMVFVITRRSRGFRETVNWVHIWQLAESPSRGRNIQKPLLKSSTMLSNFLRHTIWLWWQLFDMTRHTYWADRCEPDNVWHFHHFRPHNLAVRHTESIYVYTEGTSDTAHILHKISQKLWEKKDTFLQF